MVAIRVVNVRRLKPEERAGVCYVGRAFAGWPASPWGNPFPLRNPADAAERDECLAKFCRWFAAQPVQLLRDLWEACGHGAKPLGCWCVTAAHGDGRPVVCHAQLLAAELHRAFVERRESVTHQGRGDR